MTRAIDIEPTPGSYGDLYRKQLEKEKDMAEQVSEGNGAGHNVADLNKTINECCKAFNEIDAERKDLNEQAGEIRERLVEAGVGKEAFQAARRQYNMEPEGRAAYQDSLRLCLEAMGIGGQGTLFPSDDDVSAAKEKSPN